MGDCFFTTDDAMMITIRRDMPVREMYEDEKELWRHEGNGIDHKRKKRIKK